MDANKYNTIQFIQNGPGTKSASHQMGNGTSFPTNNEDSAEEGMCEAISTPLYALYTYTQITLSFTNFLLHHLHLWQKMKDSSLIQTASKWYM
jgi:hypothetical protein